MRWKFISLFFWIAADVALGAQIARYASTSGPAARVPGTATKSSVDLYLHPPLPSLTSLLDPGGQLTRADGVRTSGHVLAYGPDFYKGPHKETPP
jgi:hypothetical protein